MKYLSLTAIFIILSGCTYNGTIVEKDVKPTINRKSSLSVNLVDDQTAASNPSYWFGILTLNYNVKDAMLKGVESSLKSNYRNVGISNRAGSDKDIYAKLSYDFGTSRINQNRGRNDMSSGLFTTAALLFYNTKTHKLLKKIESSAQTTYSDPASLNVLRVITYGTLGLASPITVPALRSTMGNYGQQLVATNIQDLLSSLSDEISRNPLNDISEEAVAGLSTKNLDPTSRGGKTDSGSVDTCISKKPWIVGGTAKRVDCLNKAWVDYNPSAKPMVDEFKSYRLNLARQVDKGVIDTDEYTKSERDALNVVIEKIALLDRNIQYESLVPPGSQSKETQAVNNSIKYEPLIPPGGESSVLTASNPSAKYEPLPRTSGASGVITTGNSSIKYEPLTPPIAQGAAHQHSPAQPLVPPAETPASLNETPESSPPSDGSSILSNIGSFLGSTLRLAVAAAPVVARVLIARDVARTQAAWNAYYANQYSTPRLITHCRAMGSNMISCF